MNEQQDIQNDFKTDVASVLGIPTLRLGMSQTAADAECRINGFWLLCVPGFDDGTAACAAKVQHDKGTDLFGSRYGELLHLPNVTSAETSLDVLFKDLKAFNLDVPGPTSLGSGRISYAVSEIQNWQLRTVITFVGSVSIEESGIVASMNAFFDLFP